MPTKFYKDIQIPYDVIIYSKYRTQLLNNLELKHLNVAMISNIIASKF